MSKRKALVLLLFGLACVGMVGILLRVRRPKATVTAVPQSPAVAELAQPGMRDVHSSASLDGTREPISTTETNRLNQVAFDALDDAANEPTLALEDLKAALLDSFEASLLGVMEPEIFLEAALQLVRLEADPHAVPEPDLTGALRFKLSGTPEEMAAELWVRRTSNPRFSPEVLSLRLSLEPPHEPYIVEGAARKAPEATITVWRDVNGAVKNFGVLTHLYPDSQSAKLGLPLDAGEIPWGVLYNVDMDDPSQPTVTMSGLKDGSVGDLDHPIQLGRQPPVSDIGRLSSGLESMYGKIKDTTNPAGGKK